MVVALAKATTTVTGSNGVSVTGGNLGTNIGIALATVSGLTTGTYGPQANATPAAGGTFTVPSLTVDSFGRVTSAANRTVTIPSNLGGSVVSISNRQTSGTRLATLTIDGTGYDLYYTDTNTDTNTHNTAYLYVGGSSGTSNASTSNGSTYLILNDGGTYSRRKIAGSGSVSVSSDSSGNITINGTDTNTHNTASLYVGGSSGTSNASTSNGSTYLILNDGGTYTRKKITGSGSVAVTSDSSGNITISGTDIDTNTHNTAYLYVGGSNATSDSGSSNGYTHLILNDGGIYSRRKIQGSGAVTVSSDSSGTITIGDSGAAPVLYFDTVRASTYSILSLNGNNKSYTEWGVYSIIMALANATGEKAYTCIALKSLHGLFLAGGEGASTYAVQTIDEENISCFSDYGFIVYTGLNTATDTLSHHRALYITPLANYTSTAYFGSSDYDVAVDLNVSGNIIAKAAQNKDGHITTAGYANIGGKLTVGDTSSLGGKVTITSGGLACTGAATFSSTVTTSGAIKPSATNTYSCGGSGAIWTNVYAKNTTIQTSDKRLKTNVADIPSEILDIWEEIKLRIFEWTDSETPRLHVGIIAQDTEDLFKAHGLDIRDYSFFCYDKWEDEYEDFEVEDSPFQLTKDGTEIPAVTHIERRKVKSAGDSYAIRYTEFLIIESAYQRRRADRLQAQLDLLAERVKAIEQKLS